jgi:uncharacterized protein (TIGR03118 family)
MEDRMFWQERLSRMLVSLVSLGLTAGLAHAPVATGYKTRYPVFSQPEASRDADSGLSNAWGLAFSRTGPIWISDNNTGLGKAYTGKGLKQSTLVTIPTFNGTGIGSPTGVAYNNTSDFVVTQNGVSGAAVVIFVTEDGTISGWSPSVNASSAVIAVDNWPSGADYAGVAIATKNSSSYLYACDHANNRVDIYDGSFNFVSSFTDANLPAGSAPYNVALIKGRLYVTFTESSGGGVVDVFDTAGNFVKTFASGGTLKSPWGLALAPGNFGPASNTLLVGNFGNGTISYFNIDTGKFGGQLRSTSGGALAIGGLRGLQVGAGNSMNGTANELFFTAGARGYAEGAVGAIEYQ